MQRHIHTDCCFFIQHEELMTDKDVALTKFAFSYRVSVRDKTVKLLILCVFLSVRVWSAT